MLLLISYISLFFIYSYGKLIKGVDTYSNANCNNHTDNYMIAKKIFEYVIDKNAQTTDYEC